MKCFFRNHSFSIEGTSIGGFEGTDYRIRYRRGILPVLIMAPHGGLIEPGTSELADATAGEDFWFYAFEGIRAAENYSRLHIPSTLFNEPRWLTVSRKVYTTIAIHGIRGSEFDPIVVGGRDLELSQKIVLLLKDSGFNAIRCHCGPIGGMSKRNVVNRNLTGSGVQLEIPRGLRDSFLRPNDIMLKLAGLVRTAIFGRFRSKTIKETEVPS
ncbi:poly-gamma-glutamate hydrolase family protein [Thermodesulforhabdus norvegica]|nr:poly-gamma-glutamate hydrolase family protein [Thermodesulforhabdus norvegica]